mmetsp:Transcript_1252/g.2799  ORF Transcript_1252/g.2799 Transcript_1252/m.2799 type:complete len:248 (+) Transcript_1252:994-1737(+)
MRPVLVWRRHLVQSLQPLDHRLGVLRQLPVLVIAVSARQCIEGPERDVECDPNARPRHAVIHRLVVRQPVPELKHKPVKRHHKVQFTLPAVHSARLRAPELIPGARPCRACAVPDHSVRAAAAPHERPQNDRVQKRQVPPSGVCLVRRVPPSHLREQFEHRNNQVPCAAAGRSAQRPQAKAHQGTDGRRRKETSLVESVPSAKRATRHVSQHWTLGRVTPGRGRHGWASFLRRSRRSIVVCTARETL